MKRSSIHLGIFGLVLLIFAGCSAQDPGISPLVPENALAFVQVNDPVHFIENLDNFSQTLEIDKLTGSGIKDFLEMGLKQSSDLEMDALQLSKPLAVAILPALNSQNDFRYIIYIPVKKMAESSPKLNKVFAALPGFTATNSGDYCIYYSGSESLEFPPKKAIKLASNIRFENGALTLYGDIKGILGHYSSEYTALKQMAIKEIDTIEASAPKDETLGADATIMTKDMLNEFFKLIEQMENVAFTLKADATGLKLTNLINFSTTGALSKVLKEIGPGSSLGAQTKYLPANYLYTGAFSGNAAAFKEIYKQFMNLYFESLKTDDSAKAAIVKLMDDSFRVMGKNASFGLDIKLDPRVQIFASELADGNFADLFTINASSVAEISNADDYNQLLNGLINDGSLKKDLDTLLASSGMTLSVSMVDQKDGDFSWKELKYDLEISDPSKINLDSDLTRKTAAMMAGLMQKFNVALTTKGKKVYMTMGENSPSSLKKLVENDKVEPSVDSNVSWKNYLKTIPTDAQFVGNIQTARLIDLVNAGSHNSFPVELKESERTGIFSYMRLDSHSIESSSYWNIQEIKPISQALLAQFGGLFGR